MGRLGNFSINTLVLLCLICGNVVAKENSEVKNTNNKTVQMGQLNLLLLNQPVKVVTQDCSVSTIHCVGPGLEYDTSIEYAEMAFQAAADAAMPGDTIAIKGGTYHHKPTSSTKTFLTIRNSGTQAEPITITSFNNEKAHIVGFGFPEGTEGPSVEDERLIYISGDYIHITNIELSESTRWGLVMAGSYGLTENVSVHDCWKSNILIYGVSKNIEYNTLRYVETYRSRHGTGIWLIPSASKPKIIRGTLVENSISYQNGYQPDGKKVPGVSGDSVGGGNSDGFGAFKNCAESADDFKVVNLCPESIIRGNIVWHNADDGIDVSFGDGSELIDNISFENGPEGNKGYKIYAKVSGGITFVGNVAMGNISNGFEFQIEETGSVYNNTSIRNNLHGFRAVISTGGILTSTNNLGAYNDGSIDIDAREGIINTTNWAENEDGDPLITTTGFDNESVNTDVLNSGSIMQKVQSIKNQFQSALTPLGNSPLVDAGTLISDLHCLNADDDPHNPAAANEDCRHWFGEAPDIGAYEYGASNKKTSMPSF